MAMENTNKKPRFPHTVKKRYAELKDGQCCWQKADHIGFHFFRCPKLATRKIDEIDFCGIHANSIEIWRKKTCKQN